MKICSVILSSIPMSSRRFLTGTG